METSKLMILCILAIFIAIGVALIYNAREIVKKFFSTGNQNTVVYALKLLGTTISILSALIFLWQLQ